MSNPGSTGYGNQQFSPIGGSGGQYTQDYFLYVIGPFNIAAAATAQGNINIQADSNFIWQYSTMFAALHSLNFDTPITDNLLIPITVQIADGGSGRQLFSAPVPINSLAGIGREPYVMPINRIFMSKSTVNFSFTSIDANNQWDFVTLTLHGRKSFALG